MLALDKRYNYLDTLLEKIVTEKKVLDMATFVRIKIELDFLQIKEYNPTKLEKLQEKFMGVFAQIQQDASIDTTTSRESLNDRYYSLDRKLERISEGKLNLTLTEYLTIEQGLKHLEEDEYIQSRIDILKATLANIVLLELQNQIVEYAVADIEEEEIEPEVVEEENVSIDEIEQEVVEEEHDPITIVTLIDGGFSTDAININVNDTVVWVNERTGQYKMGFILGNRNCRDVRSKFFYPPDTFNATFTESGTCWISDGIFTTQAMEIVIT